MCRSLLDAQQSVLPSTQPVIIGVRPPRLTFQMDEYHRGAFFPETTIEFRTKPGERYHVPLTWSRYGYSTYRGS